MKIGYVILHYISEKDTEECVESIQRNSQTNDYRIVIVDNFSPNNSGKHLLEKYKDNPRIKVIINKKNLGFSKGNNVGIRLSREEHKSDFVVVLNNDTYICDQDFEKIIIEEYKKSKYAVLGPKVLDPDGYNASNPGSSELPTLEQCNEGIIIWTKKLIKALLKKNEHSEKIWDEQSIGRSNKHSENCRLHGCCLIFSPQYFQYFDGFVERTFMYGEETILLINLRENHLKSVYEPTLRIFHKEAVVTKMTIGDAVSAKRCWLMLKASIALKKEMERYLNECDK